MTQSPASQFSWQVVQPFLKKTPPIAPETCLFATRGLAASCNNVRSPGRSLMRNSTSTFILAYCTGKRSPCWTCNQWFGWRKWKKGEMIKTNNLSTQFPSFAFDFSLCCKVPCFKFSSHTDPSWGMHPVVQFHNVQVLGFFGTSLDVSTVDLYRQNRAYNNMHRWTLDY